MDEKLEYSVPEREGMDSQLLVNFLNEAEKTGNEIHGIMVLVHNKVIFEAYNEPYQAEIPHVMHSFTKCLTNTAVGLAFSEGLLTLEDPILKYFPEYEKGANDYLKKVSIRNLLTMRSGQERSIGGNEWRPLKSSWIDAYFRVPFVKEPGSEYLYSSGNSYILSAIVQKLTGRNCREYIREKLMKKMGVSDFEWMLSPEGICSGGNGVSLTVRDMAKIGLLYLNQGKWSGEQLLAESWVSRSLGYKERIVPDKGAVEYNFHWEHAEDIWASRGMFGQTCALIPELDMVVAFTAADNSNNFTELLQKELVNPAKSGCTLAEINWEVLRNKGQRMTLENKHRSVARHYIPKRQHYIFKLDGTIDQITEIEIIFSDAEVLYGMRDHRGYHCVRAGLDSWIHGETSMTGGYLHHQYEFAHMKVSACAYWSEKNILMMEWRYPEMAFFDSLSLEWGEDLVMIKRWVNMNSEACIRPTLEVYFNV